MEYALELEMPAKLVIIGDLNAQYDLLRRYLLALRLTKKDGGWNGGRTVLVQMGDVPNRGGKAKAAMDFLMDLRPQAQEAGGDVLWLLGNHEVMSVLGHEAYVTADEYMEFASDEEIDEFFVRRTRFVYEMLGAPDVPGRVAPIGGRLKAWEEENAPGKEAYRRAMAWNGRYGRYIRKLPVAFKIGTLLFVHGGLSPIWAQHGLEGLQKLARETWAQRPAFYQDLDPYGVLRDPMGPLWHRAYCVANAKLVRRDLNEALTIVGAKQMVVGHTRTDAADHGQPSVPLVRQRGRLIMSDVGLGDQGEPGSALVVERGRIEVWTPGGSKSRLVGLKS